MDRVQNAIDQCLAIGSTNQVNKDTLTKANLDKKGSTDTGVGSAADDFCSSNENTPRQIVGKVDTYSEQDSEDDHKDLRKETDRLSDLDSETAHQIEGQYYQILNKKRGGYLRDLRLPVKRPSDLDSIKTEDFESEFRQCMLPAANKGHTPKPAPIKEVDLDSVKTEDIATEFMKTIPRPGVMMYNNHKTAPRSALKPARKQMALPSDADSIVTEDYENQFHTMTVKQVAKVPITNFDQMLIDSDLDTVKSQMIQDRIQTITQREYPDSINSSEVDEAKMEALIEKKLHEFFNKRGAKDSGLSTPTVLSPGRKTHSMYSESEDEEEEQPTIRQASPTRMSPTRFNNVSVPEDQEDQVILSDVARQGSPTRSWHSSPSPNASYTDVTREPVIENSDLPPGAPEDLKKLFMQKKSALRELKSLHDALRQNKDDIRQTERQIKDNRMKAEEARTQLMLAEFKRDSAGKELEHLAAEVQRRRDELNDVEDKLDAADEKAQQEEEKRIETNKEEVMKLTTERDDLKATLRSKETMEIEKKELERQLVTTKENFLTEQKKNRTKIDELQEDMEGKQHKVDELLGEKDGLEKRIAKLETKYQKMETEKNELLKEKTREYQGLNQKLQKEMQESKNTASKEMQELRHQLKELSDQMVDAQAEVNKAEDNNTTLKEKILELEHDLTHKDEEVKDIKDEYQGKLDSIHHEQETAVSSVRKAAEEDKLHSLEMLKEELQQQHEGLYQQAMQQAEKDRQQIVEQSTQSLRGDLAQLQSVLSAKELEVDVLKDRLQQQEESSKVLGEKLKQETMDQVRNALRSEREQWQQDKEIEITRELESQRQDLERSLIRQRDELETERHIVETQLQQIASLKAELEEARLQQKASYHERITALNQTKELAKEEKDREIALLKTKLEQESNREVARMKEGLTRQEEELKRLRSERAEYLQREKESIAMLERQEKTLVYEVNDECRKISNLLGIGARIVNVNGYGTTGKNNFTSPAWSKSQLLSATSSALGNLKSCTEELRQAVDQAKRETQGLRSQIREGEHRKREEIEAQREKMQQEKMRAMEQLKERLIQEHIQEIDKLRDSLGRGKSLHKSLREKDRELKEIQTNMKTWKDDTVDKISKKFQDEMNRELEKRLKDVKKQKRDLEKQNHSQQRDLDRLQREVTRSNLSRSTPAFSTPMSPPKRAPSPVLGRHNTLMSQSFTEGSDKPGDTVKLLNHLQGKVKQLHAENISLKRGGSTPNLAEVGLSSSTDAATPGDRQMKLIQQQIDTANTKARLAEHRAENNEKMLNHKMVELSKVQGTLTQQTKELMQLERAYGQLQQHATRIATRAATS